MAQNRIGCYACFQTLDPKAKDPQYRTFVQCERCGATYHAVCREEAEPCYRCAEQKFRPIRVARPARLAGVVKRHAGAIQPSAVLDLDSSLGKSGQQTQGSVVAGAVHSARTLWAILVALVLVVIAGGVGSYTYRLMQLPILSLQTILDAIIRAEPPDLPVLVGAVISGLIAASVFYSRPRQAGRRWTYLLAGIITVLVFNVWLFDLEPRRLISEVQDSFRRRPEFFYAEGITAIAIVCLIPLHRGLAPINLPPQRNHPQLLKTIYGWSRLLIVGGLLGAVVVNLATQWLPDYLNQLKVAELVYDSLPGAVARLSVATAGAIATVIALAAVLYWPPPFRQVHWHLGLLRLLMVLAGIIAIGLLYRNSTSPDPLLAALELTGILMLLSVPIQRALS